jgi:hypothetical protein
MLSGMLSPHLLAPLQDPSQDALVRMSSFRVSMDVSNILEPSSSRRPTFQSLGAHLRLLNIVRPTANVHTSRNRPMLLQESRTFASSSDIQNFFEPLEINRFSQEVIHAARPSFQLRARRSQSCERNDM